MIKSKLVKSVYGKVRVIVGYKDYDKLYVFKQKGAYMLSTNRRISLDDMVKINGEYWFSTLRELHMALNKGE